jgi:hypothetical protein
MFLIRKYPVFKTRNYTICDGIKGKAIPVTGHGGP